MYEMRLIFLAKAVVVDTRTRNVSAFSIINNINAENFPVLVQDFTLCYTVDRDLTTDKKPVLDVRIRVELNGKELIESPAQINFFEQPGSTSIITFQGFLLTEPGKLSFKVIYEGHELGEYVVRIEQHALPPVPPT